MQSNGHRFASVDSGSVKMRTGATHLRPGVTPSAKFASSPPEMQSEQATLFRGWRVSALAFLRAVGNHLREATHAHHTRARARAHTKPSSSSGPDTSCLKSGIRRREEASPGEPRGASPAFSRLPLLLLASFSLHLL